MQSYRFIFTFLYLLPQSYMKKITVINNNYSYKKQKNSLKGNLDWVLIKADLWVPEYNGTQATSGYVKCKQWMHWKYKTIVFNMWRASWNTDISFLNVLILTCFR